MFLPFHLTILEYYLKYITLSFLERLGFGVINVIIIVISDFLFVWELYKFRKSHIFEWLNKTIVITRDIHESQANKLNFF